MGCTILSMVGATCLIITHISLQPFNNGIPPSQSRLKMLLPINDNIPTITPFVIYIGNCPLAFLAHVCILQLFQAYYSESFCGQVYRYSPNLSITRFTQATLCSLQRITSTRWFVTSYLKSVNACLQNNIPLRAYQSCSVRNDFSSLTPRLTTPPQMNIPKCDSH